MWWLNLKVDFSEVPPPWGDYENKLELVSITCIRKSCTYIVPCRVDHHIRHVEDDSEVSKPSVDFNHLGHIVT